MARNRTRKAQSTLLLVGEGSNDAGFLKYMKSIYDGRDTNQKVTVQAGDGGSPKDLIQATFRKTRLASYDKRVILMDSDVDIRQQDYDLANKNKMELLLSIPLCLEGMLLEALGHNVGNSTTMQLKSRLGEMLQGNLSYQRTYQNLFNKQLIDNSNIAVLRRLVALIENK